MLKAGFFFGLLASAPVIWSCTTDKQACPTCSEAVASESGAAPASPAGAIRVGFCGDGIWDREREECDDGSSCRDGRDCTNDRLRCQSTSPSACQPRASDGCSEQCTLQPGFVCPDGHDCHEASGAEAPNEEQSPLPSLDAGAPLPGVSGRSPNTGSFDSPPRPERCRRPIFRTPEVLTGIEENLDLWAPSLASDGRTLFFAANTQTTVEHIFFATRSGRSSQFSAATLLPNVDSGSGDGTPVLSADGLHLYFYSQRAGGSGNRDLWVAARANPAADFDAPVPLETINSPAIDHLPWVSADELSLLFVSARPGGFGQSDVWLSKRAARSDEFAEPGLFGALSDSVEQGRAVESRDGRLIIFASARAGGQGSQDLWFTTRAGGAADEFVEPTNLSVLNSPSLDLDPFLAADERELFFSSNRNGRTQIWRSLFDCED